MNNNSNNGVHDKPKHSGDRHAKNNNVNDDQALPLQGGRVIAENTQEICCLSDVYRSEVEFLKAFAHNPDAAGLYCVSMALMPSNFYASPATKFIFSAFYSLYCENKSVNYQNSREFLGAQKYSNKTKLDYAGELLEDIFNLSGIAGERPIEIDIKSLVYKIKENSFKAEAKKILSASINKLNQENSDYINTIKKCSDTLISLIESSSPHAQINYEPDPAAMNLKIELETLKSNKKLSGLDTGFPLLNTAISGIERELYLIGGASSMGKTTFITYLTYQLLTLNSDLNIVFFSLDQSQKDILTKFISAASGVPVKYIKCPSPRNDAYDKNKKEAIKLVSEFVKRLRIIDESYGDINIKDFKHIVRKFKIEFGQKPLLIIADTISAIKPCHRYEDKIMEVSDIIAELKTLVRSEDISMIGTYNLESKAEIVRPRREDIIKVPAFVYEPYVTMTIYSDFILNFETPFLEWEWGSSDMMVPIVEIDIVKSKMTGFKGRLFYRYYDSAAIFKECVDAENENYRAMIENLTYYHQKRGNQPIPPLAPPAPTMPINAQPKDGKPPGSDNAGNSGKQAGYKAPNKNEEEII